MSWLLNSLLFATWETFFLSFIFHYTLQLLMSPFSFLTSLIHVPLLLHIFRLIKKICLFNAEFKCIFFQELPMKSPGNTVYLFPIWCFFYLCFLHIISWEIDTPVSAALFFSLYICISMYIVNSSGISDWMKCGYLMENSYLADTLTNHIFVSSIMFIYSLTVIIKLLLSGT